MSRNQSQTFIIVILMSIFLPLSAMIHSASAQETKPTKLKVLSLPYLSFSPYFISLEEGYFAEQSLEIEFVKMRQITEAVPAFLQKKIDVLAGFINVALLNVINRKANVKLVADKGYLGINGCAADVFMTPVGLDIQKMLESPDKNKSLRFSGNVTSVEGYFMNTLVSGYGMSLSDTHIEYIPNPAAELNALKNNSVDIALVSEPWVTRIKQAKAGQVWQRISNISPSFQSAVIAYGPRLLTENRDAGQRFMIAYLKGVRQFKEGKTERNIAIISKHTKIKPELLKDVCWTTFSDDGSINSKTIADFANWAVENDLLDEVPSTDIFWDGTFVDFANQVLDGTQ